MKGCLMWLFMLPVYALEVLFRGWVLMLGVGIVHAEWLPQLPTIGYWVAVLIAWVLGGVLSSSTVWREYSQQLNREQ